MTRIFLVCIFALSLARPAIGQQSARADSFVVQVRDTANKPLWAYVTMRIGASSDSTRLQTDEHGHVTLRAPARSLVHLRVRMFGWDTVAVSVSLDTLRGPVRVTLRPMPNRLSQICTTEVAAAISLTLDSIHRRDTAVATIRVVDGAYTATRRVRLSEWLYNIDLAPERPGTYRVEVLAPGYRRWHRRGAEVRSTGCHVTTQAFRVRLTPLR